MSRAELTIAIPTFNRVEYLKKCLTLVKLYSKGMNIEIIVSDNASTDNTSEFMKEYVIKHPDVKYYKNDFNLGPDRNFLNCFKKAKGNYIWILSDDDIILSGAIESVLKCLKKNPIIIHLNTCNILKETPLILSKNQNIDEDITLYNDKNRFLKDRGISLTFISSLVFNLKLVNSIENMEQYCGTSLLQTHIAFEIMKNDGIYIFNKFSCVAARSNKIIGYDLYEVWIKQYTNLIMYTGRKCGFNEEILRKVLKKDLNTTIYNFVLKFRKSCKNEKNWNQDSLSYLKMFPKLQKKYYIAMNCPKFFLLILKIKNKIERVLGNYENKTY